MKRLLENPAAAFLPWIVIALVEEFASVEVAAGAALAAALLLMGLGRVAGLTPKLLDTATLVFFTALAIVTALSGEELNRWLEQWTGEISSAALTAIGLGSIVLRRPFTLQYAPEPQRGSREFVRANYVISAVWTGAFAITAVGGVLGHVLTGHDGNFWTAWVIQAGALIFAAAFTGWYPDVVRARARRQPGPPVAALALPLCPWLITLGVLTLALDTAPDAVGVALIVAGAAFTRLLRGVRATGQRASRRAAATSLDQRSAHP